jgi:hypothetical protein
MPWGEPHKTSNSGELVRKVEERNAADLLAVAVGVFLKTPTVANNHLMEQAYERYKLARNA